MKTHSLITSLISNANHLPILKKKPHLAEEVLSVFLERAGRTNNGWELIGHVRSIFERHDVSVTDRDLLLLFKALSHPNLEPSYDPKGILQSGKIHPRLADKIKLLLERAWDEGLRVQVFEGYRSLKRQSSLSPKVTQARGGRSFHNYGLAVDLVFLDEKGRASWSDRHNWRRLGEIGKKLGLVWGGDFKKLYDAGHFEYHPGLNISDTARLARNQGLQAVWTKISQTAE